MEMSLNIRVLIDRNDGENALERGKYMDMSNKNYIVISLGKSFISLALINPQRIPGT